MVQYSCVSDAEFEIDGADSRVFFYSEFEPDHDLAFKYSTAIGLNDLTPEINPTFTSEIDIVLKKEKEILSPAFRYDPIQELFISPYNAQEIVPGSFYSIKSSLKDFPEFKEINATTYIPQPREFTSIEVSEDRSYVNEEVYIIDNDVQLSVDPAHSHYEIEAYIYNPESINNLQKLDLSIINTMKGITVLPNRNSVIVESKELNNQFIRLNISDSFSSDLLAVNEGIIIKLKTVTPDHFRYHITLAKELETSYAPLFEPVINFTNIENGIGLLSGFSSISETLEFTE